MAEGVQECGGEGRGELAVEETSRQGRHPSQLLCQHSPAAAFQFRRPQQDGRRQAVLWSGSPVFHLPMFIKKMHYIISGNWWHGITSNQPCVQLFVSDRQVSWLKTVLLPRPDAAHVPVSHLERSTTSGFVYICVHKQGKSLCSMCGFHMPCF